MNIYMTTDYASDQLFWPNIVRAIGQALVMTPLSAVATAGIEADNAGSASALFNMMRNMGGAVGIALLQTLLTKREQYHSNVLTQPISLFEQATRERIDQLTLYFINHRRRRSRGCGASRHCRDRQDRAEAGLRHGLQRYVLPAWGCDGHRTDRSAIAEEARPCRGWRRSLID